jgi:hypothetical protein
MRPSTLLSSVFLALASSASAQDDETTYLVAPALVTKNNETVFECWQLTEPFKRSSVPGVSGTQVATISNNTNFAYTILPPRYDGGIHTAPAPQYAPTLRAIQNF